MMRMAVLSLTLLTTVNAMIGLDSTDTISTETFQCLKQKATYDFFIGQIWQSVGIYDNQGMQNMKNAKTAGLTHVHGYMLPCLESRCAQPANQIEAVINEVRSSGTPMETLWLDIARLNGSYWSQEKNSNRNAIVAMVQKADSMGASIGIGTNYYAWEAIVGLDWDAMSKYPLWSTEYTGHQNTGFMPFGGWDEGDIYQYGEDRTGICGVGPIYQNWGLDQ